MKTTVRLGLILLSLATAACNSNVTVENPDLPPTISAWTDDRPFGQDGVNLERSVVRDTEGRLASMGPDIQQLGTDVVLGSNLPRARQFYEDFWSAKGWEAASPPAGFSPDTIQIWTDRNQVFAVRYDRIYPEGDMWLVTTYTN